MNTLVLKPEHQALDYALFRGTESRPSVDGRVENCRGTEGSREAIARIAARVPAPPDAIAVRAVYGGDRFRDAVIVTGEVLGRLEALTPQAPLHVAALLPLLGQCEHQFPSVPRILVFETAFFTGLPSREYLYALDADLPRVQGLRRYGFHGILHEAACRETVRRHHAEHLQGMPRILSICLEPRPELAAVCGLQPVMVTSGATPLEGLPGQTSCGELDPSIVIALATEHGWGAEQINTALTQESGFKGLTGADATLEHLYKADNASMRLAREIFQYRLLLACGAGMAAMGGLDAIVFSGRFVSLGQPVFAWLQSQPLLHTAGLPAAPAVRFYQRSLARVIADNASTVVMAAELKPSARGAAVEAAPDAARVSPPLVSAGATVTAAMPAGPCPGACPSPCV